MRTLRACMLATLILCAAMVGGVPAAQGAQVQHVQKCKDKLRCGACQDSPFCGFTLKEMEQTCTDDAGASVLRNRKGVYAGATTFRVTFGVAKLYETACKPYGTRSFTLRQELRPGLHGKFAARGPSVLVKGNKALNVKKSLTDPYGCTATGMAGSAVRASILIGWIPKKGMGKPRASTVTYWTKPVSIC